MNIEILESATELGRVAGKRAAVLIRAAIDEKGHASVIVATGTSQFETLKVLVQEPDIDWTKVVMFHLDEYIDLPESHPASFRKYLKERFLAHLPALKEVYLINGEAPVSGELKRLKSAIGNTDIDVALVGIGENGHLAFNDPPADFETGEPYLVVGLDEACRLQQMGEGWFASLDEVPKQAISMSVKQILKSKAIIASVPDVRKAQAVKNSVREPVSNLFPASILQDHPNCRLYLDTDSASLL